MDFGGGEFYHWLAVFEGICALSLAGLAFHCFMMGAETENFLWWFFLGCLALAMLTPMIVWATQDLWLYLFT